ncbi:hypothetical protein V8N76_004520 [Salmonella enterica]
MSKTKAAKTPGAFDSSGFKGVSRRGSKYAWRYVASNGQSYQKTGYDTPEEAAYAYDEFVISQTNGNGMTNQILGLLKPRDIIKIRDKLNKQEIHTPAKQHQSRELGMSGYKGVRRGKTKKESWNAQVNIRGKYVHLGTFPTAEAAARAYDTYVLQTIGPDAVTNVSLGVLPPPDAPAGEIKKLTNKEHHISGNENNVVNISSQYSPEHERERQIQAARILMQQEELKSPQRNITAAPAEKKSTSKPAIKSENKPVTITAAHIPQVEKMPSLEEITVPDVKADIPEPNPASHVSPSDIMAQAMKAMHDAWEKENHQERQVILGVLDKLAVSVSGYQTAVNALIDHGADLEKQIQELRGLLGQ